MNQLYKFYNKNASSIRGIIVADCPWLKKVDECDNDKDDTESNHEYSDVEKDTYDSDDDLENICPKYLIFSTGSKTYIPHQVGFKIVRNVNFPKRLERGPSLKDRIATKKQEKILQVCMLKSRFFYLLTY